jgi:hypothetical protein
MKKIQAKKKRDKAEAAEAELSVSAPEDGKVVKSMLDNEDDLPVLFT